MKYKKQINKFLLLLVIDFGLISTSHSQITFQFECTSIDDDYITLKIWNQKKGGKYKLNQAQKDAIKAILYSGVPSTDNCIGQKPILQNLEEQKKIKKIENEFFARNGTWLNFTRSSDTDTVFPDKLADKKSKVYSVIIARTQLRKYLEEKEIIKPLNSIF